MSKESLSIANLIARSIRNDLSKEDKQHLDDWIKASPKNKLMFEEITNWDLLKPKLDLFQQSSTPENWLAFIKLAGIQESQITKECKEQSNEAFPKKMPIEKRSIKLHEKFKKRKLKLKK